MTLAYRRAATTASGWDAWGTLAFGTTRIALRRVVVFGGMALVLAVLLLRTGGEGVVALWTNALFLGPLVLIGSLTRTVGLRLIVRFFFIGSALMGAMYLLSLLLGPVLFEDAGLRGVLVPVLEESLKIAPVVVLLILWRRGRAWSLGATDVLLLAAAAGVGFAVVEDAYIRAESGWPDQIAWLPVTELIGGRLIVGHGIWTALAGATLGLGLLLRHRGRIWLIVAAVGFAISVLDHVANNYGNAASGFLADMLAAITVSGWLPLVAFLVLAGGCIGVDLYLLRTSGPGLHRTPPARAPGLAGLRDTWTLASQRRRLAFADFYRRQAPEAATHPAALEADRLEQQLAASRPAGSTRPGASQPPDSEAGGSTPGAAGSTGSGGGGGGGMLLLLGLVGVGLMGTAAAMAYAGALLPTALILAALDVGSNCDPWCLGSGAGGLGGSADPSDEEEEEEEEEDCAGERRGVLEAQSRVDTYQAQLDAYAEQLNKMKPEAERLAQEAAALATTARNELMLHAAWDAVYRIVSNLAGGFSTVLGMAGGDPGAVAGVGLGELPGGDLPLLDAADFARRLHQYYQIIQGDLSSLRELADAEGLTNVQRFLDKMAELGSLGARGAQIANEMAEIKVDQDQWNEELEKRKEALRACEESVG